MKLKIIQNQCKCQNILALCLGIGLSSSLSAQSNSSSDGWQPRTIELAQPQQSFRREYSPGQSASSNERKFQSEREPQARLGQPQPTPSALNWIPSGQIPTSPWDRTNNSSPSQSNPSAHKSNTPFIQPPRSISPTPHSTIHQPGSGKPNGNPATIYSTASSTNYIGQPQTSNRPWEQLPERGQSVQLNAEQPIVDLGWPIPADSSPYDRPRDSSSEHQDLPLEAHRQESSAPLQGSRRASRNPDSHSNEIVQSSADYISTAPSSVVGIVAIPAASANYTRSFDDPSMNTFVPSHDEIQSQVITASNAENDRHIAKMRLASQVSRELLSDSQQPMGLAPMPIEPPAGWKSIEGELRDRMAKCDELLKRNAVLSARDEVLTGLRLLFRAIDLRSGNWTSEPALDQALAAFTEEADFQQSLISPSHAQSTGRIVEGHATHALKQVDLSGVSPELAAQHYRSYARNQLVKAAQGHPWAADLIYGLGKTYERRADSVPEQAVMFRNQAVACYAAALDVVPNHGDGANQLGYALLKLDRVNEAQTILTQAVQTNPSSEVWRNLAEVYRRQGQSDQQAFAIEQVTMMGRSGQTPNIPEVIQIDPIAFAGISPSQQMNQGIANNNQALPVSAASASAPVKSSSWISRLLR